MAKKKHKNKKEKNVIEISTPEELIRAMKMDHRVSGVKTGIIKTGLTKNRGGEKFKFSEIKGGIKAIFRGISSLQEITIFTNHPKEVIKCLR